MTTNAATKPDEFPIVNREISWLAFNDRVLQEAMDESVPLIERLRFLGIFSSNRDEFFKVRVATLNRLEAIGDLQTDYLFGKSPRQVLDKIQRIAQKQEKKFNVTFGKIIEGLRAKNIFIIDEKQADEKQRKYALRYFHEQVRASLVPIILTEKTDFPFLKGQTVYLAIKLYNAKQPEKFKYAIMEVPAHPYGRFTVLPTREGKKYVMLLDDVIRVGLDEVFNLFDVDTIESYSIKVTRDAELDIDDDISKSMIDKLSKSVKNRAKAKPTRFVYDKEMPDDLLKFILKKLKMRKNDNLISGGRYHNFSDFISFPSIGAADLRYKELPATPHPAFGNSGSMLSAFAKKDILLHHPYQPYRHVVDVLREAAIDPKVKAIRITLYRVAPRSQVTNALMNAVQNGKQVTVLVELHARFDEEANIEWAKQMQSIGVDVIHGVPGLKVHSKLFLIDRKESKRLKQYAFIGTGNFHEKNAKVYTDYSLLTADTKITREVAKVFEFFNHNYKVSRYSELLVSPLNTRRKFVSLINNEIKNSLAGKEAWMIVKMNSLLDEGMVKKLYEAGQAGVKIRMIVRGICSLIPGVPGLSENIEVRSIVDRFLEHSRVEVFANGGDPLYYLSSADWMGRNLDKRVEVTVPIFAEELKQQIQTDLDIMLSDNQKARVQDEKGKNHYFKKQKGAEAIRSQMALYERYQKFGNAQE